MMRWVWRVVRWVEGFGDRQEDYVSPAWLAQYAQHATKHGWREGPRWTWPVKP